MNLPPVCESLEMTSYAAYLHYVLRCVSGASIGKGGQWVMSGGSDLGILSQPLFAVRLQSSCSCHSFSMCHLQEWWNTLATPTLNSDSLLKKIEAKTKLSAPAACIFEYNFLPSAAFFLLESSKYNLFFEFCAKLLRGGPLQSFLLDHLATPFLWVLPIYTLTNTFLCFNAFALSLFSQHIRNYCI